MGYFGNHSDHWNGHCGMVNMEGSVKLTNK